MRTTAGLVFSQQPSSPLFLVRRSPLTTTAFVRNPLVDQVGQLTWTIVTICMIVAQVKFVAHNIFNGIFWFFFPASLVICNDITAYFW